MVDDEDEEIPEDMLPLLDEEVEYMKEFIEEEVVRRLQAIEDQEDQEKDDETRRMYEKHKKKMLELEKRMTIIHEKDEKLKKYIAEKRSDAEKSKGKKEPTELRCPDQSWKRS